MASRACLKQGRGDKKGMRKGLQIKAMREVEEAEDLYSRHTPAKITKDIERAKS